MAEEEAKPSLEDLQAAIAAMDAKFEDLSTSVDLFFVLTMGIICFLLQAGFGLLEVGSIRAKNAQNIMLKNLTDAAVTALAYYLIGYSFAYGSGGNVFIGSSNYFGLRAEKLEDYDYIYWYFNFVFAGTAATIVSGAVAERCQFRAYLVFSFVLGGLIFPVASHWIWDSNGFLNGKAYDFAGGGAVHMVGGVAAAVGSYFLGPRKGRFVWDPDTPGKKKSVEIPGHNMTLASLGAILLWFGFFAFNGGSGYSITGSEDFEAVGRAVVVTTLGGASGAFVLMAWGMYATKSWRMGWVINGLLAGTVATCAGANAIEPWAAIILGALGAVACQLQIYLFVKILLIDDPLNASACHLAAGATGMIYVAFMAHPDYVEEEFIGLLYGGEAKFLAYQLYAMFAYSAWTLVTSSAMFFTLNSFDWFRVSEAEEVLGVDKAHHGGTAYPVDDTYEEAPRATMTFKEREKARDDLRNSHMRLPKANDDEESSKCESVERQQSLRTIPASVERQQSANPFENKPSANPFERQTSVNPINPFTSAASVKRQRSAMSVETHPM